MRPCCNAVLSSGTAFAVTPENTASTMAWCTKSFMRSSGPGAVQEVVEGNGSGGNPGNDGRPIGRVPILAAYSSADTDRAVIFPIRTPTRPSCSLRTASRRSSWAIPNARSCTGSIRTGARRLCIGRRGCRAYPARSTGAGAPGLPACRSRSRLRRPSVRSASCMRTFRTRTGPCGDGRARRGRTRRRRHCVALR